MKLNRFAYVYQKKKHVSSYLNNMAAAAFSLEQHTRRTDEKLESITSYPHLYNISVREPTLPELASPWWAACYDQELNKAYRCLKYDSVHQISPSTLNGAVNLRTDDRGPDICFVQTVSNTKGVLIELEKHCPSVENTDFLVVSLIFCGPGKL